MVFEINKVTVARDQAARFETAFAYAALLLRRIAGCRSVALMRCVERPGHYQVRVGWGRIEDHVDHYPTTSEAAEIRALLRPLIETSDAAHFHKVALD
jgi:heme-degrading monooxygenase HmoA